MVNCKLEAVRGTGSKGMERGGWGGKDRGRRGRGRNGGGVRQVEIGSDRMLTSMADGEAIDIAGWELIRKVAEIRGGREEGVNTVMIIEEGSGGGGKRWIKE